MYGAKSYTLVPDNFNVLFLKQFSGAILCWLLLFLFRTVFYHSMYNVILYTNYRQVRRNQNYTPKKPSMKFTSSLGVPGCSWVLLVAPRFSWVLLHQPMRQGWVLQGAP